MALDTLPLARLRFDLTTLGAADVPAYKGDMLRMALLWWLSDFWCPLSDRCRHGCRRPDVCMFGRLNEPKVDPAWPKSIRYLVGDTPPPAFGLWDQQDRRCRFAEGDAWSFELTLIGALALRQLPAIGAAVQQGAEQGMGRIRLRSRIRQVTALPPAGDLVVAAEQAVDGGVSLTWQSYSLGDLAFGYEQAAQWVQQRREPVRALSLRFLSPAQIKERGKRVETPRFEAVMKAVVRRLRILSVVHGGGEWPQAEYGPLLDLAETVRMEHDETVWTSYTRYSRHAGEHDLEGFVGQAWYAGDDLRPLLPALWLGQWAHIGKACVIGNGRYTIAQVW